MSSFALALLSDAGARIYPLRTGRQRVGRSAQSEIVIDDVSVSREHAEILVGTDVSVRDLQSVNGTRVRAGSARRQGDATERRPLDAVALVDGQPHSISVGTIIEFGSAMAVLVDQSCEEPAGDSEDGFFRDPVMLDLLSTTGRVAKTDVTVLLLGETGVGKEVFAQLIHRMSGRVGKFVVLNCAAVPAHLFESELFGHEKGSFTGATEKKRGLLEHAHQGSVFLDEIGEMPLEAQAKLLRVLATKTFRPIGFADERPLDVRVIAATNRDLEAEARAGRFREDLYYRLAAFPLAIPPLRDRKEEILPLAERFLSQASRRFNRAEVPAFTADARAALLACPWRGNVRELRSRVERAAILATGPSVDRKQLGLDPGSETPTLPPPLTSPASTAKPDLHGLVEELERERIVWALEESGGNQTKAAAMLGISRRMLIHRIEAFDLPRPRKKG